MRQFAASEEDFESLPPAVRRKLRTGPAGPAGGRLDLNTSSPACGFVPEPAPTLTLHILCLPRPRVIHGSSHTPLLGIDGSEGFNDAAVWGSTWSAQPTITLTAHRCPLLRGPHLPSPLTLNRVQSSPFADPEQFFSNVERLRIRLAQSDPSSPIGSTHQNYHHGRSYRPSARLGPGPLHHHAHAHSHALQNHAFTTSLTRGRGLEKRSASSPKKLRKPGSLQLAYLVAQADSQCFHSLPAKIQQKLFSAEERRRLRHVYPSPSDATLPVAQPDTVFYDSDSDFDESDASMDPSLYDSFRWLDEDGDLDLSLDEYHAHVADAATARSKSRRRTSFRRSLSFSTHSLRQHRPSPSMPTRVLPSSVSIQPLSPLASSLRSSRPASRRHEPIQHAPKSSTSSIDPTAQYYQDPDARLKLRVYLASPQKFDEAIEFGFPSVDQDKENVAPGNKSSSPKPLPLPVARQCTGTFFEDDDGTVVGSPGGSIEEPATPHLTSHPWETMRPSTDTPSLLQRRQSFFSGSKMGPQRLPGNREMTLKMTLTRPDLRTESPTPSQSSPQEDPLRLAALPPADRSQMSWDSDLDDRGVVKKMWRRIRRRA
ncbi:uncharacterized protein N7482_007671 [Penicillium canariense]|uniref:Uncharacterized protein n=1 Tax=Penicillium canariense TaxID=189055 RepID=A0A9W9LJD1_9EURO|nr:uncharacterized protein N7482_007671 [Penicillium canariense]KAJ5160667.1 hypothetical protein N7482_007671 [Penicillium canariense]